MTGPDEQTGPEDADEPGHAEPGHAEPDHTQPEEPEHDDAGLDLAREIARATAAAGTAAGRLPGRSRRRTPRGETPGTGKPGETRRRTRRSGSGAFPSDRDPQTLDTTLGRLVGDRGWTVDLQVQGVFGRWAEIVGDEVSAHCTPESFSDGHLKVRTDSTAWATQLRLLAPNVVRRLNEELGHGTVLVIDVEGPHAPSWRKGRRRVNGRGPRDTYG